MNHLNPSTQEQQIPLTVFADGLGKAGMNLHGGVWNDLKGFDVTRIGYDTDPERRKAAEAAGILVINNLSELPAVLAGRTLNVVDNTTSSGEHASSTRATLDVLASADLTARAWLLEKPVVSSEDEKVVLSEALAEIGPRVFVNENYLASKAVAMGCEIIATQEAAGNPVSTITVDFVKDRVPNVLLDNRFTDTKGLAVYGIEMPHQLAIASVLHGSELDTRPAGEGGSIVENTYYHDIDGIEQSEGNVTVFNQHDKVITLRQGLGPFEFSEDNSLVRRTYDWRQNEAERYAAINFADGSSLRLTFDPVAGAPRYHSKVEFIDASEQPVITEVFEDNTLRNLIGAVAAFAASEGSNRGPILDQLQPEPAMRYFEQLRELRAYAGEPVSVPKLSGTEDFAPAYLAELEREKIYRSTK